ncbi:hypothetical protein E2C01_036615 [Portunus trituberculatus]|uniref:Uncharacterized protein n=1 Tax=Portunus trituberculatus TaxID=210409 RepID=A0A5B7F753_PORTR|nr:hypothetical protein [Portunus trituberculatus]
MCLVVEGDVRRCNATSADIKQDDQQIPPKNNKLPRSSFALGDDAELSRAGTREYQLSGPPRLADLDHCIVRTLGRPPHLHTYRYSRLTMLWFVPPLLDSRILP